MTFLSLFALTQERLHSPYLNSTKPVEFSYAEMSYPSKSQHECLASSSIREMELNLDRREGMLQMTQIKLCYEVYQFGLPISAQTVWNIE